MTDTPAELDEALASLPPASETRGDPGHDKATDLARGVQLLQLRAARMTYAQIAQQLGYADGSGARQALIRALERHETESAAELRELENLALDADERALRAIITDRSKPDGARIRAIDARVRLSARRSRLNGLDAPVAVALSAGVDAGLTDSLAELEAVVSEVIQLPLRALPAAPTHDDDALEA